KPFAVGTKVICPKCKERFAVDNPDQAKARPDPAASRPAVRQTENKSAVRHPRSQEPDEASRPVRRRKGRASPRGKGPWIALGLGGSALLIGAVVIAIVLSSNRTTDGDRGVGGKGNDRGDEFGRIPATMQAYLPNDTSSIVYANVKNQLKAF